MAESAISQFNMIGADKHLQSGQPRTSAAPSVAHVGLTDPALMETHFKQQNIPLWDTERIVESRNDHPAWMHEHFAYETLVSGEEREVDKGPGEPASQPQATLATTAKHPHPYFYFPGKP